MYTDVHRVKYDFEMGELELALLYLYIDVKHIERWIHYL